MNRLLIFVHYNLYDDLSSYVLKMLESVCSLYSKIVFVSNSKINEGHLILLDKLCDKILQRENKGFDFGAWKDAILDEKLENIANYDSVTLINDTCFGPIFDINDVFKKMENLKVDFWGITDYKASDDGMPPSGGPIDEHIQSYFMVFNNNVLKSKYFIDFWNNLEYLKNVNYVIQNYETKLTKYLSEAGFKYDVYLRTKEFNFEYNDLMIRYPDVVIKKKVPFVKIKSFQYFKHPRYILNLIKENTNYDLELINEHFYKITNPNISYKTTNKTVVGNTHKENIKYEHKPKIAIHFHVYYPDVFIKYLNSFRNNNINFIDFYISTDSIEKKLKIDGLLKEYSLHNNLKEIIIVENRGRDVLPWISNFKKINDDYDIVGHFHAKKTYWADEWIGASWQDDILDCLIKPINEIIFLLETNKNLGIVIPDIPYYYGKICDVDTWGGNKGLCQTLWDKMNLKKNIDFQSLEIPIMSYGTMFWYKPSALKPLFDLNLGYDDFQNEPLPIDGSIAHAIERLPVYIAWAQNYDFRVMMNNNTVDNSFINYEKTLYYLKQLKVIQEKYENEKRIRINKTFKNRIKSIVKKIIPISLFNFLKKFRKKYFYIKEIIIDIESGDKDIYQIFYDTGEGFDEKKSIKALYAGNGRQLLSFSISEKKVKSLRIDPGTKKGIVKLNEILIRKFLFYKKYRGNKLLRKIIFVKDIFDISIINDQIVITCQGDYPYFQIKI
ncbi:MAG TPA: rhamnan synthesis F family protein [Spirochaetota bacterium]|nr:rhamnan synthesis F family protein [Spirochaetota bacterium]